MVPLLDPTRKSEADSEEFYDASDEPIAVQQQQQQREQNQPDEFAAIGSNIRAMSSGTTTTGIHFGALLNTGTVFDTDHVPTREERELHEDAEELRQSVAGGDDGDDPESHSESGAGTRAGAASSDSQMRWWTKEELAEHLSRSSSVKPNTDIDENDDRSPFEIRKSIMSVIFSDPNTGEPRVWKQQQYPGFGKNVTADCTVSYEIEAYSEENDEPFDSSKIVDRTFHSNLSNDPLLPGLYVALTSMKVGEKSQFILHHEVAFGKFGCPPRIPPEADIFYDIEVKKVLEEGTIADFIHKDPEQQQAIEFGKLLEMADSERKSGNAYFVDGRKKQANIRYKRAIKVLEDRRLKDANEEKQVKEILLKLYCNTANASLFLNRPYVTMHYCRKALDIDPKSVKALFHYGRAKVDVGDYDEAVRYLLRARQFKPHNAEIANELARLNRRVTEDQETSRDMERRMAGIFVSGQTAAAGATNAAAADSGAAATNGDSHS